MVSKPHLTHGSPDASTIDAAPRTGGVRFAPSPTGRFHLGNLRTAWVSYQFARAWALPWAVRFEDIDRPRVLSGARERQLQDMAAFGMVPDVELTQSTFHARHLALFELARSTGAVYACTCSRRDVQMALAGLASAPHDGLAPVYSGACRSRLGPAAATIAWRFKMPREDGHDDFIVARTDSIDDSASFTPAYHWACAIDDFDGAYDLIVRSADLAPALPLQRAIQGWIARAEGNPPVVTRAFHTSLVTQDDGHRLEKRTLGVTLPELYAAGWDEVKLWRAFEKSFDRTLLAEDVFGSQGVAGESMATLRLSDLLNLK
jgi:glutamyl-tRNA synthetase